MKIILLFLLTLFSLNGFGTENRILLQCSGKQFNYYNSKYVSTDEIEVFYVVRFDKFLSGDKKIWFIEKSTPSGFSDVIYSKDKWVSSSMSFEKIVNVTDSLIYIYQFSTIKDKDEKTNYREEINRYSGVWTTRMTSDYLYNGNRVFVEEKLTGKCIKQKKQF